MSPNTLLELFFAAGLLYFVNYRQQRQRIALLARALQPYQIERLMQALIQGYLRAMGEAGDERRMQVLGTLQGSEEQLGAQVQRLAADFQKTPEALARTSRLPISLPWATQWLASASFDLRRAFAIHAEGIARAMADAAASPRDRAFAVTAELLLFQHSCHWFCKSRTVASARLMARQHTPWTQVIASVTPQTRSAYLALINGQRSPGR